MAAVSFLTRANLTIQIQVDEDVIVGKAPATTFLCDYDAVCKSSPTIARLCEDEKEKKLTLTVTKVPIVDRHIIEFNPYQMVHNILAFIHTPATTARRLVLVEDGYTPIGHYVHFAHQYGFNDVLKALEEKMTSVIHRPHYDGQLLQILAIAEQYHMNGLSATALASIEWCQFRDIKQYCKYYRKKTMEAIHDHLLHHIQCEIYSMNLLAVSMTTRLQELQCDQQARQWTIISDHLEDIGDDVTDIHEKCCDYSCKEDIGDATDNEKCRDDSCDNTKDF